jgi:radical SAM protein with 4Fe4S-binding SPASM domain
MTVVETSYVARVTTFAGLFPETGAPPLYRLDMELTERCNNSCIHCCINLREDDAAARAREMTTGQVSKVLIEAAALGARSVRFTGGEPLLRPDFADIYLFARRLGLGVVLFTNGRLITPELADLFARIPPLEKIEITVYGMTPESYDAVTMVKGAYEEFRRGVDLLLDRKVPFILKGALLPSNRDQVAAFDAWARTIPGMTHPPTYSMFFDLRVRRDSPAKNRQIARLRVPPEEGLAVRSRKREDYLAELRPFCAKFMGPGGSRLFNCGAGKTVSVDAYGVLQPCLMLRHPDTVYDLKNGSLDDALTNFFPRLHKWEATNAGYLTRCAQCFLKGLCEQCPAKSWMEHGTLDTPVEYVCQVAHAQAADLGLINPSEKGWEVVDWRERLAKFSEAEQSQKGGTDRGKENRPEAQEEWSNQTTQGNTCPKGEA